ARAAVGLPGDPRRAGRPPRDPPRPAPPRRADAADALRSALRAACDLLATGGDRRARGDGEGAPAGAPGGPALGVRAGARRVLRDPREVGPRVQAVDPVRRLPDLAHALPL